MRAHRIVYLAVAGCVLASPVWDSGVACAATSTPVVFHVDGHSFVANLPPSSVTTFTLSPKSTRVKSWMTAASRDGAKISLFARMQRQPDIALGGGSGDGVDVIVNSSVRYQKMIGFGAAMTESSASLINASPARRSILDALVGKDGARFSVLRTTIGASDFVSSPSIMSYDEMPDGRRDPTLSRFSTASDEVSLIPILKAATTLNPGMRLFSAPWSAPGWMKSGGRFIGSCDGSAPRLLSTNLSAYASYLAQFVDRYIRSYKLRVSVVSLENEPRNCNSSYPTMLLEPSEEAQISSLLRDDLNRMGHRSVGIMAWDHNWYEGTRPTEYPMQVLTTPGAAITDVGFHSYEGADGLGAGVQSQVHGVSPSTAIDFTEGTGILGQDDQAQNLVWEVRNDLIEPIRNWARTSLYWNAALDPFGGPHVGGCGVCRGMTTVDNASGTFSLNEDYYYWSQFSRFVPRGSVRIASSDHGPTSIETVAFVTEAGTIVIVALNPEIDQSGLAGDVVQWGGDPARPRTSWLVGTDLRRRWIRDAATASCLAAEGAPGPVLLDPPVLDSLPDLNGVWATCGQSNFANGEIIMPHELLVSGDGSFTLKIRSTDGAVVISDRRGEVKWTTGVAGDYLLLCSDGDLREYRSGNVVWDAGVAGRGATRAWLESSGNLRLLDQGGGLVWQSGSVGVP